MVKHYELQWKLLAISEKEARHCFGQNNIIPGKDHLPSYDCQKYKHITQNDIDQENCSTQNEHE